MNLFEQFGLGVKSYIKALSIVFSNGLWIYFIYPIIIYALLFFAGFAFIHYLSDTAEQYILGYIDSDNAVWWLRFLKGFLHFFLSIGLKIIFFLIYSAISKYIVLILMSPAMAILSAKTETILTGRQYPFDANQFTKDVVRGIALALRNMLLQLAIVLLSFIVIWIPLIGWLCPIFLLIISYYFYGFSMMDYVNERRKLNVSASVSYIRRSKGIAIGTGFIFALLFNIPFVGVVFASVLAPVAGCVAVFEKDNNIK